MDRCLTAGMNPLQIKKNNITPRTNKNRDNKMITKRRPITGHEQGGNITKANSGHLSIVGREHFVSSPSRMASFDTKPNMPVGLSFSRNLNNPPSFGHFDPTANFNE
jgi:hypothetical protein